MVELALTDQILVTKLSCSINGRHLALNSDAFTVCIVVTSLCKDMTIVMTMAAIVV